MLSRDADIARLSGCFGFLAERGLFGFAELDDAMVVRWRRGTLADWLPLGQPICGTAPAFFGLETDLLALQDGAGGPLTLPKIGLDGILDPGEKVSIDVHWRAESETYLMVLSRFNAQAGAEYELIKQIRARRIAEDNYRLAREEIVEKETLLNLVIDHAPIAIAMFGHDRRYIFASKRWADLFGTGIEPLQGRRHDAAPPYSTLPDDPAFDLCLAGAAAASRDANVARADGGGDWVRILHQPWRGANGLACGVMAFAEVLTERYETEARLSAQNAELKLLNEGLDEFAAIVAHDFSVPLRAIRSAAAQGGADALALIDAQARRMETMLRDLMDYCRAGARLSPPRSLDIAAMAREIAAGTPQAEGFDLRINGGPFLIEAPRAPVDLALRNLIDNAVKHHHAPPGVISIRVSEQQRGWEIVFADDGPGVEPALADRLFRPFQRGLRASDKPGSGVGLALAKKVVEAHGGTIAFIAGGEQARGAAFRLFWPRTAAAPAAPIEPFAE